MDGSKFSGAAIEVAGVQKYYGAKKVLDGVSFSINQGEIVSFLGPSGSGKTTLLKCALGLERLSGGSIRIMGADSWDAGRIKGLVGFVTQADSFYEELSCMENLQFFGQLYGLSSADIDTRGRELLKYVDLDKNADSPADSLSGGQRKRLNIVLALLHAPSVLFMDEPTVGLDPVTRTFIWQLVRDVAGRGVTVLMTTHYMQEAQLLSDKILILDKGKTAAYGSVEELSKLVPSGHVVRIATKPGNPEVLDPIKQQLIKEGLADSMDLREGVIVARSSDPEALASKFSRLIKPTPEEIRYVEIDEPSLEDVFFYVTGKRGIELAEKVAHA